MTKAKNLMSSCIKSECKYLIITIDLEEDNWGTYNSTGHTVRNIEKIISLQGLFNEFKAIPTYLISYPVVMSDKAVNILKKILEKDRCEIGAHCHPWNTPPFEEEIKAGNSMLCNLPPDLQYKKIEVLHEAIKKKLGITPLSFRAGRWGYNADVARNIHHIGYKVDSSITSFVDWRDYEGPNFSDISPRAFKYSMGDIANGPSKGDLVEVPATVGFLQGNFDLCNYIFKRLSQYPINKMRAIGVLNRLKLLNRVWLSPEISDSKKMIQLAQCMVSRNYKFINMFFHSTSLMAKLTPYVKTLEDEKNLLQRIRDFLVFKENTGVKCIKLSDAACLIDYHKYISSSLFFSTSMLLFGASFI